MTKWKDTTAGGHKILWREELTEGDRKGWSFGCVEGDSIKVWNEDGQDTATYADKDALVPAEPEVVHTKYINVYEDRPGFDYDGNEQWPPKYDDCLGRIRIDWLSDGTYTVSKEEV